MSDSTQHSLRACAYCGKLTHGLKPGAPPEPYCGCPVPLRYPLPPEVEAAARTIHRDVWREPYRRGRGPMHFAGGPYWRNELRRRADRWERLAAAARICAEALPHE